MQAIILLAGYGSRLARDDLAHKSFLPFGDETLLSRHLAALAELGAEKAVLILGHNKEAVKEYVNVLPAPLPVEFVDNAVYRTTGNTLSMVMGLRRTEGDVIVLDGDVLYPRRVFLEYARRSEASSFATVPADIGDDECAKTLLNDDGSINAFVTKRALTNEERDNYKFGGEAIGFFKLSGEYGKRFADMYDAREAEWKEWLWEIPFTEFSQKAGARLHPWSIDEPGCFEIDDAVDYQTALTFFEANREQY